MSRGYLKAAADDASQVEGEIQEEWNMIARDIYAFYPLLIKYVDLQRNIWIRHNVAESEDLYNHVGEVFNTMNISGVGSMYTVHCVHVHCIYTEYMVIGYKVYRIYGQFWLDKTVDHVSNMQCTESTGGAWLRNAASSCRGGEFTQPRAHLLYHPCTLNSGQYGTGVDCQRRPTYLLPPISTFAARRPILSP